MKYVLRFFTLAVLAVSISCKKETAKEIIYFQRNVSAVAGAGTGTVNQLIPISVSWFYSSGSCDVMDKFEENRQGNIIWITAIGHSSGTICTTDAGTKVKIYNFLASTAGTYELRFLNKDNSYLTHTIIIN
jgi:hypothetical protein